MGDISHPTLRSIFVPLVYSDMLDGLSRFFSSVQLFSARLAAF